MRVVVLHESPGADSAAREFREAAEEFNLGLDIRLRFLEVGFELRTVPVREDDGESAIRLTEILRSFRPGVVLLLGRGERLLESAALAARERTSLAFCANGRPDRTTQAIARLAGIVVRSADSEPLPTHPDAEVHEVERTAAAGATLVDILVRSIRDGRRA